MNMKLSSGLDQRSHRLNYNLILLFMKILMILYMRLLMAPQVWIKNLHMKALQVLMILENWIAYQKRSLMRAQMPKVRKSHNNMKLIVECVN